MSFLSNLSKSEVVSQQVFNPTGFAILASIGIHTLILGFGFPSLSSGAKTNTLGNPRPVNVIELTPSEQTRLPDLSPPAFEPSDLANLPSNTPLPDISNLDTALPPPSLPNAWDSLPSPPLLPPLNYGSRIPIALPPQSLPRLSIPRPLTPPAPPLSPQASQLPGNNRPNFGPLPPPTNPDELINRKFDPDTGQPLAAANTGSNGAATPPVSEEDTSYNAANTTHKDLIQNAGTWLAENNIKTPKAVKEIGLAGNYPQAACPKKLAGTARYVVSVNPDGAVTGEPRQLQSTGYGILNQQAVRDIKSRNFPKPSPALPYYYVTVAYQFNPQVCPEAAATTTPNPQPSLTPGTSPASSPSPPTTTNPQPRPTVTPAVPTSPTSPPQTPATPAASPKPSPSPTAAASPKPKPQATPTAPPQSSPSPGIPAATASPQSQPEEKPPIPEIPKKSSQAENGPLGGPAARKKL